MPRTEKPRRHRGRSAASGIILAIAMILTPVAIVTNWAAVEVDNTNHFVETLSPLASNPEIQDLVITEITNRVDDAVNIKQTTTSLVDGIGQALNLPDSAKKALGLVSDPLAAGVKALVKDAVTKVVKSEGFQTAWTKVLTITQEQATKLLKGQEGGALSLSSAGKLSVNLKPVIGEVKQALVNNGVEFANAIPDVDISIDLGTFPELAVARVVYQVGVGIGTWLPWIVLGLFLLGIALAVRRLRVIVTVSTLILIESVLLLLTFNLSKLLVINTVGLAYAGAVGVAFDALAAYVFTVLAALIVLSIIVGAAAWIAGGDERAPIRRGMTTALEWSRSKLDGVGMTMGSTGQALYKFRVAIRWVILALAALVIVFAQPMNVPTVIWTTVVALILLLALELLLRVPATPVKSSASRGAATSSSSRSATKAPARKKPASSSSRSRS